LLSAPSNTLRFQFLTCFPAVVSVDIKCPKEFI